MPKLPNQWIRYEAEDGEDFCYDAAVTVDSEGLFRVSVDDRLADTARKLHQLEQEATPRWRLVHTHGKWRVEAKALQLAKAGAEAICKAHLECESFTQRVIVYRTDLRVAFVVDKEGHLHPNGGDSFGGRHSSWWIPKSTRREIHANNPTEQFAIGLYARVFDKTTYKRVTGETHKWEEVDMEEPEGKLNAFPSLRAEPGSKDMQEMPYTPEAADYFYDLLLAVCRMGKNLDDFFADRERLTKAIEERKPLKLLA